MRTLLEVGWGDPDKPDYIYWSEPGEIPSVGDLVNISQRDTDGTDLGSTPQLVVRARIFSYQRSGASARLDAQLWCEVYSEGQ